MLEFLKSSFLGGLKQKTYSTRLSPSEYYLLINGRTRRDVVEGIMSPLQDESVPTGKLQGIYGAGNLVLLFASGQAFVRDYSVLNSVFQQITTFSSMNALVDFIYAELVPVSTVNFGRKLFSSDTSSSLRLTNPTNASPSCVVCQDGINQARLILPDGTSRVSQNYIQWNQNSREYVPIGKQMAYSDGILFTVSPNGREIFQSVDGRPIDYMVNITVDGDKLALESEGGASSVSHAVAFNPITGIGKMAVGDQTALFVSTLYSSHLVVPDYTRTLFGNPTYGTIDLFDTGMVGQFVRGDLLGDAAFIDSNGIRSFNAVRQVQNEGKNLPFSAEINPLLAGFVQDVCAVTEFDNYTIFGLQTIYGNGLIWYDTINQSYVSLDIYPEMTSKIKQFCSIKLTNGRRLFCITEDNKYFEILGSDVTASGSILIGEFTGLTAIEPKNCELKPEELRVAINNAKEDGNLTATLFVDRLNCGTIRKPVAKAFIQNTSVPYGQTSADSVQNITFNLRDIAKTGWKFSVLLSWDFQGEITDIYANAVEIQTRNSVEEQARELAAFRKI